MLIPASLLSSRLGGTLSYPTLRYSPTLRYLTLTYALNITLRLGTLHCAFSAVKLTELTGAEQRPPPEAQRPNHLQSFSGKNSQQRNLSLIFRCCACSALQELFYHFFLLCDNVICLTLIHISVYFHLAFVHTRQHVSNLGKELVDFPLCSNSNPKTSLAA